VTARRPPGFTLLEVLVALAIGALALGALGALVSEALGNVGHAEEYIEATQRAQSRLEQVGTALPLTPGEQSGSDGGGFSWTVAISPPHIHVAPAQEIGRAHV
jgi:general secretion pathway protein I